MEPKVAGDMIKNLDNARAVEVPEELISEDVEFASSVLSDGFKQSERASRDGLSRKASVHDFESAQVVPCQDRAFSPLGLETHPERTSLVARIRHRDLSHH